jgi:hypothetical protein
MRKFLEKLGTQPDRLESECSSTSNPQRPDDQFFTALEAQFNDPQFQATLPWSDAHLSSKKNDAAHFPLSGRRDATYLRKKWATAAAKFETAHNRYTQSGETDECYCLCGATGFYTFSGWTVAFAQDEQYASGRRITSRVGQFVRVRQRTTATVMFYIFVCAFGCQYQSVNKCLWMNFAHIGQQVEYQS